MDPSTEVIIIFIVLFIVGLGSLFAICLCCLCWFCRRSRSNARRDEELGQSYELKNLVRAPGTQADIRPQRPSLVEDRRITNPFVENGSLYGQEISKIRQTINGFFTDPKVISV